MVWSIRYLLKNYDLLFALSTFWFHYPQHSSQICKVTYETSSLNKENVQVQYAYHCSLFLIFDQTTMAQEKNI